MSARIQNPFACKSMDCILLLDDLPTHRSKEEPCSCIKVTAVADPAERWRIIKGIEWLKERKNEKQERVMTFEEYDIAARKTAFYPRHVYKELPIYPSLKLTGEAGEFSEKVGKLLRDKGGELTAEDREALLKELGDVLWYVSACAQDLGSSLTEVAWMNIDKLTSRSERGKLEGSGDER